MRSIYRAGRGSAQELGLRKIGLWPVRRSSIAATEMSTGWPPARREACWPDRPDARPPWLPIFFGSLIEGRPILAAGFG